MQTSEAPDSSPNSTKPTKSSQILLSEKSWLDYLWIIREHWMLALLVGVTAAAYYVYKESQAIPLYRSTAVTLFEIQRDRVINVQEVVDTTGGRGMELVISNHLTDLRSNSFRSRIINSLTADEIELIVKDYRDETDDNPSPHAVIAGANHIRLVGGNIFYFTFHHRNPQAAALLANRFSDEFSDFLLERARRSNESALRFLRSQSEELRLRVERSELAVQRYRQERNLVSLEESQNLIVDRLKSISANLNNARIELLNISTAMNSVREAAEDLDMLSKLPAINQMGNLNTMMNQRIALISEQRALSIRYGNRHPRMVDNRAAIKSIEKDIEESIHQNIANFSELYRATQDRVASLETALEKAEQESLNLDQIAIEYNVLRRKLETDKQLFTQVHTRLNEALLASQLTDVNLRTVDRAWPAGSPFFPDNTKTYSLAAFIFLICFAGTPFAIYFMNLNLKTIVDLENQLHTPFLGEIRRFPKKIKDLHLLVLQQLDPEASELFRQIHSQILLKNRIINKGQTFIVTSAIPKEGKSFFAINLAASFSRHHYKTLLMDCDYRRPVLAERLNDLVADKMNDPSRKTDDPILITDSFFVLPAAKTTIEATEHIESMEFRELLSKLKNSFDIIIVDTPPSGLFPDAALIGDESDQFIFLTQLNKHRKAVLSGILNRLSQSRASILGVVVNRVTKKHARNLGAYSYTGYGKYKNYYPTPKSTLLKHENV